MNSDLLVADARDEFLPLLAAELTDAAYQLALRFGVNQRWCELELQIWVRLTQVLERRLRIHQVPAPDRAIPAAAEKDHTFPNRSLHMLNVQAPMHNGFQSVGAKLLVVVDHHRAIIYHNCTTEVPPEVVLPIDPLGRRRQLRTRGEPTDGKRKPEQKSYYDTIALKLIGADQILIFGSGTGESSAMEHLCDALADRHPVIGAQVVGTVVIDSHHLTEPQLLANANEYFNTLELQRVGVVKRNAL